jgi:hypothetical protein
MRFSYRRFLRLSCFRSVFLIAVVVLESAGVAPACPICGAPTVTLAERLARADAALLVEWVSAQPGRGKEPESTTYEVVQVQRDPAETYKAGGRVEVPKFTPGKSGNLYLLLGRKDDKLGIKWEDPPLAVSETSYQYIVQAPSPETPAEKRLAYFLKFLEFPDLTIANDAFAEFVNAPNKDIAAIAGKLPREKLRRWLADPKTPVTRQSGFGVMLGLCGRDDDARFLEQRIAASDPDRQIGTDGLMFGYLMLAGDEGLATLEKLRLTNGNISDGEVFAAVQAIQYYWTYGNGKIAPALLQRAMRRLLDRPALADTAITTLARWKDWSLHERLMQLYGTKEYDEKSTKKAIISYMIASTRDVGDAKNDVPPHVVAGRKNLERLRQRDPKLVEETEKFYHLQ